MDWHNLLDMPLHHTYDVTTQEELDDIIDYCVNDVMSTREIFFKSKKLIQLRGILSKTYDLPLINASETKLAKEILLKYLSETLKINKKVLRNQRTYRSLMSPKDLLLPIVSFKTAGFKILLEKYKNAVIDASETKGGFKYSLLYKGLQIDYGLGGVKSVPSL